MSYTCTPNNTALKDKRARKVYLKNEIDRISMRILERIDKMVSLVARCSPEDLDRWLEEQRSLEIRKENLEI